ncbi:hypothetical protein BAY61_32355 (plasmid) [Prauserella marina]|uniref:Uncharacterized protein n=1 Tax=Prauserella marina TaxID=530584 RepID=A0A222W197_9PSEU|nr:hypothetical protein [Prauserella marina]ASR39974.1 hypothetical protein BAY61_32355 [Prauserella marina]PWV71313.1 hypothetical protein DES30_11229 [Prauserella marina]SDD96761.1 hypothetical protein SAMN05421630_11583 [Prauserella marina]
MAITPIHRRSLHPRMFSMADYRRSYVLYDGVDCNIPRWGREGEFGVWNYARGVLVEISRALHGTPVSLYYRELVTRQPHEDPALVPAHLPVGHEITIVIRDPDGELVTVVDHRETWPYGARGDVWELTVNGIRPEDGHATFPPSLPWMANIVRWHLHQHRPLALVIPIGRAKPA